MIKEQLFARQDLDYKTFQCKLMPTVSPDRVIGVRTPQLRQYAKEISGSIEAEAFLLQLPHVYYEEDNLHGMLIEGIKDYQKCIDALQAFLPYVDNWATCDLISPKVFKKHLPELREQIPIWLGSEHTYVVRFGIKMLMQFCLDEAFETEYPDRVAQIRSEEYYINMMIAWYFATALAKQYETVVPYIENHRLDVWTHNKAIQKAIESYRITEEQKKYLRSLKRKK